MCYSQVAFSPKQLLTVSSSHRFACLAEYDAAFGVDLGDQVPQRELPEGWRAPAAAHRKIKAAEAQLRQGAKLWELRDTLDEWCSCLELDYEICQVNSQWLVLHAMYFCSSLCSHSVYIARAGHLVSSTSTVCIQNNMTSLDYASPTNINVQLMCRQSIQHGMKQFRQ